MPEHDETIQLKIASPRVNLDGIDEAIKRLKEYDSFLERLATQRDIRVRIGVEGGALDGAISQMRVLQGLLHTIGETDLAEGLKRGAVSIEQVSQRMKGRLFELKSEYRELGDAIAEAQRKSDAQDARMERSGGRDVSQAEMRQFAAERSKVMAMEASYERLGQTIASVQSVSGAADVLVGLDQSAKKVAAAETAVTTAAKQADVALGKQGQTADKKAGQMKALAAQGEKVAAADDEATAAAQRNAAAVRQAAEAQGRLLRQRTTTAPGQEPATTAVFSTGVGRTRTINSGDVITDEINKVTEAGKRFDALKADFAEKRAAIIEAGAPRRSSQTAELLRQEAEAIERQTAELGKLSDTNVLDRQRARAAGLRQQAGGIDQAEQATTERAEQRRAAALRRNDDEAAKATREIAKEQERLKKSREQQARTTGAEEQERLNKALATERMELQSRETVARKSAATDRERAAALRSLAEEYETLSKSALAVPGPLAQQMQKQAQGLRAEAGGLETRADAKTDASLRRNDEEAAKATREVVKEQEKLKKAREEQARTAEAEDQERLNKALAAEKMELQTREAVARKSAATDRERAAALRSLAEEYEALSRSAVAAPGALAQQAQKQAQSLRAEAGGIEARAQTKTDTTTRRVDREAEAATAERINKALTVEKMQLQGREAVLSRSNMTDLQRAQALREIANAYDELARKAALTPTLSSTTAQQGATNQAAKLRADARAIDENLQKRAEQNRRIADLNRDYQQQLRAQGGTQMRTGEQESGRGRTETTRSTRVADGMREVITYTRQWDAAGRELEPTLKRTWAAADELGRGLTSASRGFLRNVAAVGAWGLAVGALYGTLRLLGNGIESILRVEQQTARLQAVFRGTDQEAVRLRNDVLALAAAEGRSADEAVDAAIRWARLGLTRKEAAEAVRVSLVAANVAELSSAEAAEQLAAIYAAYGLEVRDLSTVLDTLNSVSNNLNVTNKDLLQGIARTGAVAKQAGLPLAELVGLIGAGVAGTGRTGAELGNALKSVIVALNGPDLQRKLSLSFDLDVKTPLGELKDMSTILSELFVKAQGLSRGQRGELLKDIGGKQQASRLEAILENYVTAQVRAIRAQEDIGSAEREGQRIRETTLAQWRGIVTEAEKMVSILATGGGDGGFLGTIKTFLEAIGLGLGELNTKLEEADLNARTKFGMNLVNVGGVNPGAVEKVNEILRRRRQERGLAGSDEETRLEGRLAEGESRLGGSRDRQKLFFTKRRDLEENGIDDPARQLRDARVAALSLPPKERGAFLDEVRTAIERRDVQAAIAISRREELRAAEQTAAIDEENIATRERLVADKEERVQKLRNLLTQRESQGLDGEAQMGEIDKLEGEISRLRTRQSRPMPKEGEDFDPLDSVMKEMKRRMEPGDAVASFRAGIGGDGMPLLGTETESARRKIAEAVRRVDVARHLPTANPQEEIAKQQLLYGEGAGNQGLMREREIEVEKAERELALARLKDDFAEGGRLAQRRLAGFDFGMSETDRLRNVGEQAIGMGRFAVAENRGALDRGESGAREAGQAQQIGATLAQTQLALEERRGRVQRDIVQAMLEQNQEAQKALLFASREDQLRAALLARYQQQGGRVSDERLAMLSPETQKATSLVPGLLSPGAQTEVQQREAERATLFSEDMERFRVALGEMITEMREVRVEAPDIDGPAPMPPQVNIAGINFGVAADFSGIVDGILQGFQSQYVRDIAEIRESVLGWMRSTGTEAQGIGAAVIGN